MMSKFLKVGERYLNMDNVLYVTEPNPLFDNEIQVVFSDAQYVRLQGEPMRALLRWLDANSEALPGDGAADEQDEQSAYIRKVRSAIAAKLGIPHALIEDTKGWIHNG